MANNLTGLITAVITPFNSKEELDEEGLIANLTFQIRHHVSGIVLLGTTGESPTILKQERRRMIEIARNVVPEQTSLWIGTGTASTHQTIENCLEAEEGGADGVLVVVPYYNRPTQEGLYRHFAAIAASISIPICLYNVPKRTGQNLESATVQRLSQLPSIIGIKDASGHLTQLEEMVATIRPDRPAFLFLSGDDSLALPFLTLGGDGLISVASNLIPKTMKKLVESCLAGDVATGRSLHYQLLPLFKALSMEPNPIGIKAAMESAGMAAGPCRPPLCGPSSLHRELLDKQVLLYASA